jgi:hypothetical protein
VQEEKRTDDLGGIEAGPVLAEAAALLDLEEKIATIDVLHHKEEAVLHRQCGNANLLRKGAGCPKRESNHKGVQEGINSKAEEGFKKIGGRVKGKRGAYGSLEARVEGDEEGVLGRQRQHTLFRQGALHVVVLHKDVLLEHLH